VQLLYIISGVVFIARLASLDKVVYFCVFLDM